MSVCANCRLALRQSLRHSRTTTTTTTTTTVFHPTRNHTTSTTPTTPRPSAKELLSQPTWSVKSLASSSAAETVTPAQLRHLLRLSALPLPKTPEEEASMIATLQGQLRFVRAVQRVDTSGVEPLRAVRDETAQAAGEGTVGLEALRHVLDKEEKVGHYQRPKRVREKVRSEAEGWDVLRTASRRAGKFFVVQSKKKEGESG